MRILLITLAEERPPPPRRWRKPFSNSDIL